MTAMSVSTATGTALCTGTPILVQQCSEIWQFFKKEAWLSVPSSFSTTCRKSGHWSRNGNKAESRAAEVSKTEAPASFRMCATCTALRTGLTGTSTPEAAVTAKLEATVSMLFSR